MALLNCFYHTSSTRRIASAQARQRDIENNIPLFYDLTKSHNERQSIINNISKFSNKVILILDRGYYSMELINILVKNHINMIVRLCKNNNYVKMIRQSGKQKIKIIDEQQKVIYIYFYKIKNIEYFIFSSLNRSVEEIKNLYHKRWKIVKTQ